MKKNHRPADHRRDDDRSKRDEPHRREGRSSQGQRLTSGERIPFKGAGNRKDASDSEADNRRGSGPSHRSHSRREEDAPRSENRRSHSSDDRKPFRSERSGDERYTRDRGPSDHSRGNRSSHENRSREEGNYGTENRRNHSSNDRKPFRPERNSEERPRRDHGNSDYPRGPRSGQEARRREEGDYGGENRRSHSSNDRKPFRPERQSEQRSENDRYSSDHRRKDGPRDERRPFDKDRRRENDTDRPRSEGKRKEWTPDDHRSGNRRDGQYANKRKPFAKGGSRFEREDRSRSHKSEDGSMRLNKFLAHAGICSRREADTHITAGLVKVNGKVVTEMGYKVQSGDEVRYNDSLIRSEKKVYLLLNKPKGFITTVDDPRARKTVMDLVGGACKERIYPVGRLDRQTTGVLMFTNDGELADKLLHPSKGARKIYEAVLDKPLTKTDLIRIEQGLELEDGPVKVDAIAYVEDKDRKHIGLELHVGKNRIVRRIFEHLGYEVTKLDRVSFAGLTKKRLSRGQYRFLTQKEVDFLRMR